MAETLMEYFGNTIAAYLSSQTTEHHNRVTLEGIKSLFLHHLLQLRCNSHRVTSVLETGEAAADDGVVQSSHEATLGSAVFPTASLFNHSCWPNIIFRFTSILLCAHEVSATIMLYANFSYCSAFLSPHSLKLFYYIILYSLGTFVSISD